MVALVIGLIIADLAFLTTRSVYRQMKKWQQREQDIRTIHLLLIRWRQDIIGVRRIEHSSPHRLVFLDHHNRRVEYQYRNEQLYRNDKRLHTKQQRLVRLRFSKNTLSSVNRQAGNTETRDIHPPHPADSEIRIINLECTFKGMQLEQALSTQNMMRTVWYGPRTKKQALQPTGFAEK
jgi:hypothetical protein